MFDTVVPEIYSDIAEEIASLIKEREGVKIQIDHITGEDHSWVVQMLRDRWGGTQVVSRGQVYRADQLPGLIAWRLDRQKKQPVGLLTYHLHNNSCEIVTLDALVEEAGVGTKLVDVVREKGIRSGWDRLWLVTTNDNRHAQSFWGRHGFRLTAIHARAVEEARTLKPSIPKLGHGGNPILDELEYEIVLNQDEEWSGNA